ncbi:hypothetical protein [Rhizobium sp. OAE497]|uniref:hypothetical protein n=1 Tax=Rhizobium sp. OAE497 TaxID=2663796 RepID=UPI0018F43CDD
MDVHFKYQLGDLVETRRGEVGKIVLMSVCESRDGREDYYRTYKIVDDDGGHVWTPEFGIKRVVGW